MERQTAEMTLFSLSDALPRARAERRRDDRMMSLYRVGSLAIDERRELCLIKNICAGGMMVRTYSSILKGTRLTIELKCGQPISGVVSWTRDAHVGISFDGPIDVIDILSTSMDGPRPRMPRIEVDSCLMLRDGASTYRVRLCDISQGGLKIICEAALEWHTQVVVTLPGIAPQPSVVRWINGHHLGIAFNRMLALPILVDWLREQSETLRTARRVTSRSSAQA